MATKETKKMDLDETLEEIGQFGKYQIVTLLMASLPVIFSAFASGEYIFTAGAVPHRCRIPECDFADAEFEPSWLWSAVPGTSGNYESCSRFVPLNPGINASVPGTCPAGLFNRNATIPCEDFVHGRTNTAAYDFGLECEEWRRAFIGTARSVGSLLVLPITGYISDRFGRRVALTLNAFNTALFGVIRSWSNSYLMFLLLEVGESTFGAGAYSSCFILATELVGPKYRVFAGASMSSFFAIGQVILGFIAWGVPEWRTLTRVIYIPQLLIIAYFWILFESVRWLLSKNRYPEAEIILKKAAKMNNKEISAESLAALEASYLIQEKNNDVESGEKEPSLFFLVIRSKVILRRICTTPFWWVTTTFVYYGLAINSVGLAGNMYLNYILVAAVEIPGYWLSIFLLDNFGRKKTLFFGYWICAACCISFPFVEADWLTLTLYLLGKFFISIVFTSVYIYTAELFPTKYRHSLLAFSSMIGRIGSITAPLTPALMIYWDAIPSLMFGAMAFLAGCLVLTTPETLNIKLPDTFEEAEAIGTNK